SREPPRRTSPAGLRRSEARHCSHREERMKRPLWAVWLPTVFAIVVVSFVLATGFAQWRLAAIDRAAEEIADGAAPDIERIAVALTLRRTINEYSDLAERHSRLQEVRANELEEFAGRVAHDIRSPLGTVTLALDFARDTAERERREAVLDRGKRAAGRITRL